MQVPVYLYTANGLAVPEGRSRPPARAARVRQVQTVAGFDGWPDDVEEDDCFGYASVRAVSVEALLAAGLPAAVAVVGTRQRGRAPAAACAGS